MTSTTSKSSSAAAAGAVAQTATVELSAGIPFVSDDQLEASLDDAGVEPALAGAIVAENTEARLVGLRSAVAVLALMALLGLFFTRRLPTEQPGSLPAVEPVEPVEPTPSG